MKHNYALKIPLVLCLTFSLLVLAGCGCSRTTTDSNEENAVVVEDQSASEENNAENTIDNTNSSTNVNTSTSEAPVANATNVGSGDTTVEVTNSTGYDISAISIKASSDSDYAADNAFDGFLYANGTSVELSFVSSASATSYDVLLTTTNDSLIAIRNIDLVNAKDIAFHFDNGIGYITYTDTSSGETVDNEKSAQQSEQESANSSDTSTYDLESQAG